MICIIIGRYAVQIYQMVNTIQDTQNNMECQNNIKNFDLNKTPYLSVGDDNVDVMQDDLIRQRITKNKSQK